MWTSMRSSSGRRRRGSRALAAQGQSFMDARFWLIRTRQLELGMGAAFVVEDSRHNLLVVDGSAAQGPMKGEPLRRTAPYFVHRRFTRNGPLRQTVAAARSVEDNQGKHDDDEDNCFRSAGSRLTRASGVGSQRRCMRGRSIPGGMRRSAWRSRRSSWLRLRLSWRGCCAARLWRTLLLARRRSRLPLTGY